MANPTIFSSLKSQNIGEEHLPISEENNQQTIQSKSKHYQEGDLQGIQGISKVFLGSYTWPKQTITDTDGIEHDGSGRVILSEDNIHEIEAILGKEIRYEALGISESFLGLLWSEFPVTEADAIEHDSQGRVIHSKDDLKEIKAILIHEITNAADAPVLQAKGQRTGIGTHLLNDSTLINKEFLELSSADVSHSMETDITHEVHGFLSPDLVDIFNHCKCCIVSKSHLKYCQDCRIDHSNNQLSEAQKIERYWIRKENEALNGCQICPLSQWVKDIEEKLRSPITEEDDCMDEEAWSYF